MIKKVTLLLVLAFFISELCSAQDTIVLKKSSLFEELCNQRLAEAVIKWVGTPYHLGGCSEKGIDCSCLVRSIFRAAYGIELSRTSRSMFEEVERLGKKQDLEEGDLLFFKRRHRISHVGIYLHDGLYVHASTREGVVIRQLDVKSRRLKFYAAGRIKNLPNPAFEYQIPTDVLAPNEDGDKL